MRSPKKYKEPFSGPSSKKPKKLTKHIKKQIKKVSSGDKEKANALRQSYGL